MSAPRALQKTLALALLLLAAGCGDGGTQVAGGGIGGTGVSSGSVTGFGSFFVTDVAWRLAPGGTVEIDGETSGPGGAFGEDDLRLGMYLIVEGELSEDGSSGDADRVVFDEAIRGAVEQTPMDAGPGPERRLFTVLGQTVLIEDAFTIFSGTSFLGLDADDVVEVSGPVDAGGTIRATRVEKLGTIVLGTTEVELKGEVANLLPGSPVSFEIGPVRVSLECGGTTDCSGFRGGGPPAVGTRVEVEGVQRADGATPEVDATVVRPFAPFVPGLVEQQNLLLEGSIDDFTDLASPFRVNGLPVNAAGAALDPDDPALYRDGVYVRVEGDVEACGLVARALRLLEGEALAAAEIPSGGLDRLDQGEILLFLPPEQLVVQVDDATLFSDDDGDDEEEELDLSDLLVGDFIEVSGVDLGGGVLRATGLEREDDADDVELRGRVEAIDADDSDGALGFRVLGIFVELVEGISEVPGDDVEDFLDALEPGDLVSAEDDEDGTETSFDVADEVELEE